MSLLKRYHSIFSFDVENYLEMAGIDLSKSYRGASRHTYWWRCIEIYKINLKIYHAFFSSSSVFTSFFFWPISWCFLTKSGNSLFCMLSAFFGNLYTFSSCSSSFLSFYNRLGILMFSLFFPIFTDFLCYFFISFIFGIIYSDGFDFKIDVLLTLPKISQGSSSIYIIVNLYSGSLVNIFSINALQESDMMFF